MVPWNAMEESFDVTLSWLCVLEEISGSVEYSWLVFLIINSFLSLGIFLGGTRFQDTIKMKQLYKLNTLFFLTSWITELFGISNFCKISSRVPAILTTKWHSLNSYISTNQQHMGHPLNSVYKMHFMASVRSKFRPNPKFRAGAEFQLYVNDRLD